MSNVCEGSQVCHCFKCVSIVSRVSSVYRVCFKCVSGVGQVVAKYESRVSSVSSVFQVC